MTDCCTISLLQALVTHWSWDFLREVTLFQMNVRFYCASLHCSIQNMDLAFVSQTSKLKFIYVFNLLLLDIWNGSAWHHAHARGNQVEDNIYMVRNVTSESTMYTFWDQRLASSKSWRDYHASSKLHEAQEVKLLLFVSIWHSFFSVQM